MTDETIEPSLRRIEELIARLEVAARSGRA